MYITWKVGPAGWEAVRILGFNFDVWEGVKAKAPFLTRGLTHCRAHSALHRFTRAYAGLGYLSCFSGLTQGYLRVILA